MPITLSSPDCGPGSYDGFIVNGYSADASGTEILRAAPTTAAILISKITINNGSSALSHTISERDDASPQVETTILGPISMAVNSVREFEFYPPIRLTAATELVIDASGSGTVCVIVQGREE